MYGDVKEIDLLKFYLRPGELWSNDFYTFSNTSPYPVKVTVARVEPDYRKRIKELEMKVEELREELNETDLEEVTRDA